MKNKNKIKIIFPVMFTLIPLTSCNSGPSFEGKDVNLYYQNPTPLTQIKLYFSKSYSGIPFIDLNDGVDFFNNLYKMIDPKASISKEKNGNDFKMIRENKSYINFNFDYNVVTSDNINKFKVTSYAKTSMDALGNDYHFYDEKGEVIKDQVRFITTKDKEVFETLPNKTYMSLDLYNIKTFKQGDKYLVPFTTFYNIAGISYIGCLFNGQELFITGNSLGGLAEQYYKFQKQNRSKELKEYNYYEFCRDLDYVYGLAKEHGISSFDAYFSANGLKDMLLSDDRYYEDYAYNALQCSYLADSHTGFAFQNAYGGQDQQELVKIAENLKISPEFMQRECDVKKRKDAREQYKNIKVDEQTTASKVIKPVFQYDDTLFITFDGFLMGSVNNYYTDTFKKNKSQYAEAGDCVAIISYANDLIHADLEKSNPTIKKVVIDLSGNGGGAADSAIFVLSWLDSAVMQLVDPINEASSAISYKADINFDKKIDYDDFLLFSNPNEKAAAILEGKKTFDGKVYCLTSETSFSCGNYVPAMLKQSQLVKLVGTKSGGGACIVHVTGTADGTGFQFSSNYKLCTRKNGSYYSIDQGVEPDYYLDDYETLYGGETVDGYSNRSKLISYLNSIK